MQPEGLDPSGFPLRNHNISHGMPPKVPMVGFFKIFCCVYIIHLRTFSFSHNLTGQTTSKKHIPFPYIHIIYIFSYDKLEGLYFHILTHRQGSLRKKKKKGASEILFLTYDTEGKWVGEATTTLKCSTPVDAVRISI